MHRDLVKIYRCPKTIGNLELIEESDNSDNLKHGTLQGPDGTRYQVEGGLPDFTYPAQLNPGDQNARDYYDNVADVYDDLLHLTFDTLNVDEWEERNRMIDSLNLKADSTVFEMGCGSGRDTALIAKRLGDSGRLFAQELSPTFLEKSFERLSGFPCEINLSVGNGSYLPFPDNFFDASFHFGGINTFDEIQRAFSEMTRVTKAGGKVIIGDESMPVWLRDTEFGKILMNSNPLYKYPLPLEHIPVEARNVKIDWIMGGVFYVIEYIVGDGAPTANFDFEIPGGKGGTHRTRYYGQLEGVTLEAKMLAIESARKSGKSIHNWLTEAIIHSAKKDAGKQGQ